MAAQDDMVDAMVLDGNRPTPPFIQEYQEWIAKLSVETVLRVQNAFLGDIDPNNVSRELMVEHTPRVLFCVQGDHTLTPQLLHKFVSQGKSTKDVATFGDLAPLDHACYAMYIATVRACVVALCARYKSADEAKAAWARVTWEQVQ